MNLSLSWPEDKLIDSIMEKFGRGECLMYTWKSLKDICSSITLVTPIFCDIVGYERRNTVAVEKTTGLYRNRCSICQRKVVEKGLSPRIPRLYTTNGGITSLITPR